MGEGAFTMDVIFFVCYFFFCVCVCVGVDVFRLDVHDCCTVYYCLYTKFATARGRIGWMSDFHDAVGPLG